MQFLQLLHILPLLTNIPYMKFTFIARSVHTAAKQCYLPHGTAISRTCLANPASSSTTERSSFHTHSHELQLNKVHACEFLK